MNLTTTVIELIKSALSKIGVDGNNTEPANIETAHRNLNMIISLWSIDEDLHIGRFVPLTGFANLTDTVSFPQEYITALTLNLAVLLAPDWDQPADKVLVAMAENSVNAIRIHNMRLLTGSIPRNNMAPKEV
jgi:hypothetical protein